jgi:predicted outer membrane repeat protein
VTNETNANELLNTVNDTGIIIDGERKNNFFNINPGCDVNIDNLTLVNAYSNSDGATINNKGKLKLNTTFIKNSLILGSKDENDDFKDINGGAISSTGDLTIDYCTFQDNKASSYSRGGSIYSTGKLNITNSICINSTADSGWGSL